MVQATGPLPTGSGELQCWRPPVSIPVLIIVVKASGSGGLSAPMAESAWSVQSGELAYGKSGASPFMNCRSVDRVIRCGLVANNVKYSQHYPSNLRSVRIHLYRSSTSLSG